MAIDGLASGLDTNSIITQLMEIERIPVDQMIARQSKAQTASDAYSAIVARLGAVTTAANNLDRAGDWALSSATSSDLTLATASVATGVGSSGVLSFKVSQLAAAHTVTSAPVTDRTTSMTEQNPGSISLTINGEQTDLAVGSGTIDEIAGAINSSALGIRATVVNVGNGFRLQMSSAKSGNASQFTVGGIAGPDENTAGTTVTTTGRDATISIGEGAGAYTVSSSSNTFSDVMPGVTITAKAVSDDPVTVSVERDGQALSDRVKALTGALNEALGEIKKQTAYDSANNRASTLSGDSAARQATQALTRAVTDVIAGTAMASGAAVGISVDRYGTVKFDEAKFAAEYAKDPAAVERMFSQGGAVTAAGVATSDASFVSGGTRLNGGDYNVIVTQAATQASEIGMVGPFPMTDPVTIRIKMGSTELVLAIGAGAENDIDLDAPANAGGVTAQTVADALNSKFGTAKMGLTASDDGGALRIDAKSFGSAGSFQFRIDPLDSEGTWQNATGLDVAGTINGTVAKGVGQNLSLDSTSGALSGITINAKAAGEFTVAYAPGIAQRLAGVISNATDSQFGYLVKAKEGRETQVGNIKKSIEQYEIRLDARELRLRAQFASLETMLSGLTGTSSMLQSMTSSLQNSQSKK